MLVTVILSVAIVALAMVIMAVGVIFRGYCFRGSCGGGEGVMGADGEPIGCDRCNPPESEPPQAEDKGPATPGRGLAGCSSGKALTETSPIQAARWRAFGRGSGGPG